ncbi:MULTISPECIES: heptaprenyl diphosphate synthase component 1 [unclassified Peribacillus]|uniref:heptaprenyl diphosphate synthase component 1 n=1 Tax=unclassified Peribacillus TaxID=2675266 RepID=UPI001911AB80|nr:MULTISPECIES: heptaprenyl diphosphate synthase component 1 [unclassified Peribacillus]MBK5462890.1 heptaprenyl diphosphate synthase component 1 [Peribacillus sp. TH27]MBK5483769.1 heptaprenyl diphosphate synthase component 1 [Peribacillus sp. TH16]MBK5501074.1 heptaprenyl diphosphate synthase component 1 [Peribacillus sp. TH14]WMX53959.1 heptaprenyl diphosphate synthase component 1 [Peribacillus sp. R9-11]
MLNITNDLRQLKQLIETKAQHPYLLKYIQKPSLDDDKLLLLWGLFNDLDVLSEERNQYIISTMLVQIALDTHEIVSNSGEGIELPEELKNRQLQVLAGDYYSGLYYQGLAGVGNVEMIRILSSAIKKINDHKIILYQQRSIKDVPTLITTIKAIEASLIYKLADYYNQPAWIDISEDLLLLNRLHAEMRNYLKSGQSVVFDVLRDISFDDSNSNDVLTSEKEAQVRTQFDKCLRDARQSVKLSMQKLVTKNDDLLQRVNVILKQTESEAISYVKEG